MFVKKSLKASDTSSGFEDIEFLIFREIHELEVEEGQDMTSLTLPYLLEVV